MVGWLVGCLFSISQFIWLHNHRLLHTYHREIPVSGTYYGALRHQTGLLISRLGSYRELIVQPVLSVAIFLCFFCYIIQFRKIYLNVNSCVDVMFCPYVASSSPIVLLPPSCRRENHWCSMMSMLLFFYVFTEEVLFAVSFEFFRLIVARLGVFIP